MRPYGVSTAPPIIASKPQANLLFTPLSHTQRGPQYRVRLTAHEALARAEASHFVDPADAAFMEQVGCDAGMTLTLTDIT